MAKGKSSMSAEPLQRPVDTPTEWFRFAVENLAVAERELTYEEPAFHTILNEYIVAGRYPGDLAYETVGRVEADEAVATVQRIRVLVMDRMKAKDQRTAGKSQTTDVADV